MRERPTVRRFRAFLDAINRLMTRHDTPGEDRRHELEGEAAQVGLRLEEKESKGQPKHENSPPSAGPRVRG